MESKFNSLSEWRKAEPNAYNSAFRKGNLHDICEQFGWVYIPTRKIKVIDKKELIKNNSNIILKRFYEKLKFVIDNDLVVGITNHEIVTTQYMVTIQISNADMKTNNKDFDGYGAYFWEAMVKDDKSFYLDIEFEPSPILDYLTSLAFQSDLSNLMDEEYQKHFKKEIKKYNEIVDNFIKASKTKEFIFKF